MAGVDRQYKFAVCLSHDVDRIYKTYQYIHEAVSGGSLAPFLDIASGKNPWWQFEHIMDIENRLGVRSSFQILDEQYFRSRPVSEWAKPKTWKLFAGRYDVSDTQFQSTLRVLDNGGWELGLQGSYFSSEYPERFRLEKDRIENSSDIKLQGNRQHYLRINKPDTWRSLREIGIQYDMSLADKYAVEPEFGYKLIRPFDDEFAVFPWTLMDSTAVQAGDTMAGSLERCTTLLEQFRENHGVLVLDWHQRVYHDPDFPHWGELYQELIRTAKDMGAWVGPPGEFYNALPHPSGTVEDALRNLYTNE